MVPIATQALFFATPILYPSSVVSERFRILVDLNPWSYLARSYQRILSDSEGPLVGNLLVVALTGLVLHAASELVFALLADGE